MEQKEINKETTYIIWDYCLKNGMTPRVINGPIDFILEARGITSAMPMYATAFALALRDVLNELEGTYTNPAEL